MKYISHAFVLFTGLFSSAQSFATNCIIDAVFQKNEKWNSYSIDIKELENSRQANIKRMLPSINIGVGQYIQNINGLQIFQRVTYICHYLTIFYQVLRQ